MQRKASLLIAIIFIVCAVPLIAQDTLYDSKDARLQCTFQYPAAWKMYTGEGRHAKYATFDLIGPANAEQTYSSHISITAIDPASTRGKTPNEYLDHLTDSAKLLYEHYEIVNRSNSVFWGQAVPTIDVAYALPLPFTSEKYSWTIIREHKAVTLNGGKIWTFVYAADADEYDKYFPIFQHLMDTFFFK